MSGLILRRRQVADFVVRSIGPERPLLKKSLCCCGETISPTLAANQVAYLP